MEDGNSNFFSHVAGRMTALLTDVLKENGAGLFRRSPVVGFGSGSNGDLRLTLESHVTLEQDKGTFTAPSGDDRFTVFRNPGRATLPFLLAGEVANPLRIYDRLMAYFFDHRFVDPFVPDQLRAHAPLYECLCAQKAELRLRQDQVADSYGLSFGFDYVALYHSGNPLREELKTKQRVIDLKSDSQERRF